MSRSMLCTVWRMNCTSPIRRADSFSLATEDGVSNTSTDPLSTHSQQQRPHQYGPCGSGSRKAPSSMTSSKDKVKNWANRKDKLKKLCYKLQKQSQEICWHDRAFCYHERYVVFPPCIFWNSQHVAHSGGLGNQQLGHCESFELPFKSNTTRFLAWTAQRSQAA